MPVMGVSEVVDSDTFTTRFRVGSVVKLGEATCIRVASRKVGVALDNGVTVWLAVGKGVGESGMGVWEGLIVHVGGMKVSVGSGSGVSLGCGSGVSVGGGGGG